MQAAAAPGEEREPKWQMHWHVIFTHFPVSGFTGAFGFMALHLITGNRCMVLAAYVTLVASAIVLLPTTVSGWITWKRNYEGFLNAGFRNKIWTSAAMIVLAAALVTYQTLYPFELLDVRHVLAHALYFAGVVLLMLGAIAEGYWGGKLHHR